MSDLAGIVAAVTSSPQTSIVAINLLDGVGTGLYTSDFARATLLWWGEYLRQTGKRGAEAALAISLVPSLATGTGAPGFDPPGEPPEGAHIHARGPEDEAVGVSRASVRDAVRLLDWADDDDLASLEDDGVDLLSTPGDAVYQRSIQSLRKTRFQRSLRTEASGKTITNPNRGSGPILFFTRADVVLDVLGKVREDERADALRDLLGLTHMKAGRQQVAIVFDGRLAEDRDDRGRPTVIDADGHVRFLASPPGWGARRGWGATANLAAIRDPLSGVVGLPERVCGTFPASGGGVVLDAHFLGAPAVPRGDVPGVNDEVYAALLDARLSPAGAPSLADRLDALLNGTAS